MLRHPTSPTGAGSKICLEVMPIDSVTLSDGRGLEERTPTRRSVARLARSAPSPVSHLNDRSVALAPAGLASGRVERSKRARSCQIR